MERCGHGWRGTEEEILIRLSRIEDVVSHHCHQEALSYGNYCSGTRHMAGGWVWARMTPHLWAAGHDVDTPTLTGSGERSHLLSREIDLDTHVDDIAKVILVGHSYSGMVITEIVNKIPDRIAHLVFIDAFVP